MRGLFKLPISIQPKPPAFLVVYWMNLDSLWYAVANATNLDFTSTNESFLQENPLPAFFSLTKWKFTVTNTTHKEKWW